MRSARKSVSDRDLAQYQSFAKALHQSRGALAGTTGQSLLSFAFPRQNSCGNEVGAEPMEDDDEDDLYS